MFQKPACFSISTFNLLSERKPNMRVLNIPTVVLLALPLSTVADPGEAVYEKHCAKCHSSTDVNVPQIGSVEQWKFRSGYGRTSLIYSVKNGHNMMPPHSEALKDDDIGIAIDYIVGKSGGWTKK
jgi:cytochrome c5